MNKGDLKKVFADAFRNILAGLQGNKELCFQFSYLWLFLPLLDPLLTSEIIMIPLPSIFLILKYHFLQMTRYYLYISQISRILTCYVAWNYHNYLFVYSN